MAGLLKANLQLGDSATATQNFTLTVPATPDGTVKLARGNAGATTQDILTVDANGNVLVAGNNLNLFSAKSLAASGYQKLPSGLIVQWGSVTITTPAPGTILGTAVTFPIAFPSGCRQALGCLGNIPANTYAGVSAEALGISGFNLAFCSGVTSGASVTIRWMAVGN